MDYDFGLRAGVVNVSAADGQAVTTFAYHLGGMGIDFWEYTEPWETADDCIKHVWRLSCYTYFPKCEAGVTPGMVLLMCETVFSLPPSLSFSASRWVDGVPTAVSKQLPKLRQVS